MKAWYDIEPGGVREGEVVVFASSPSGKSSYYESFMSNRPKFQKVEQSKVDGEMWYTIRTNDNEVSNWLRTHESNLIVEITTGYPEYFDVHEKIYIMMELKYK